MGTDIGNGLFHWNRCWIYQVECLIHGFRFAGDTADGIRYKIYRCHMHAVACAWNCLHLDGSYDHTADHIVHFPDTVGSTRDIAWTVDHSVKTTFLRNADQFLRHPFCLGISKRKTARRVKRIIFVDPFSFVVWCVVNTI